MTGLFIVLAVAIVVLYVVPKLLRRLFVKPTPEPEVHVITFYGGPEDQHEYKVLKRYPWYMIPYIPKNPEERKVRDQLFNQAGEPVFQLVDHSYAFYQQIEDGKYFYVRDVTKEEVMTTLQTGQLPNVREG